MKLSNANAAAGRLMNMKKLDTYQLAQAYAKETHKWCVAISGWELSFKTHPQPGEMTLKRLIKAAPYLKMYGYNTDDTPDDSQGIFEGFILVVCDSKKEAEDIYNQTAGDSNPTQTNKSRGPHVYALLIDDNGEAYNENT